jgi:DNA repair protein RecN (Recombination protein N)
MLSELSIQNFAIIDRLQIHLASGFNALTGETGAGKSIIIDAVSTLLGGRAASDYIRAGSDSARVEGSFTLSAATLAQLAPLLDELGLELEDDSCILTREFNRSGKNTCRINGRAVPLNVLRQLGGQLIDIHGQGEHISLLQPRQHVEFLDRYAALGQPRAEFAERVRALHTVRQTLEGLLRDEREMARRVDLLQYQIEEIGSARLKVGEEEELSRERTRLANAEKLLTLAESAYEALGGGEEGKPCALDALNEASRALGNLQRYDAQIAETAQLTEQAAETVQELARVLRDYRDNIEFNPSRLEAAEERLELIRNLKRKYGDSIADILAFADRAAQDLENISHNEERVAELREREEKLLREIGALGEALSTARRQAAGALEKGIQSELNELRMPNTRFIVQFGRKESADGAYAGERRYAFDATGLDQIEFLIAPNPGEPPKPLALIASGGETARLMLALKSVLSAVDETPTLIFDEIDAGIGGRVGGVVGRKLWSLTRAHQVLCVTHLPQIAAFGDAHYRIAKQVIGERTITIVEELDDQERIGELCAMLGGGDTRAARRSAEEMLAQARAAKKPTLQTAAP